MKQISIVVPIHNEEKYIDDLLYSIENTGYPKENYEVIMVSDGSTDRTVEIIKRHPEVKLVELTTKVGRYYARKKGAEVACYPHVLFVDSRTLVDPDILSALNRADARAINGYALGSKTPWIFETFYNAIRRLVFPKFYKNFNTPVVLTPQNFDNTPKGTTVFYAEKEILMAAYTELSNYDMGVYASDDTKLIRAIVNKIPVLISPEVKVTSLARTSFIASVKHLYERAPRFVNYYFNPTLRIFWLVIALPLLAIFAILAALIFIPVSIWVKLVAILGLDLLLTLLLARSFREFYIITFMIPLCLVTFYSGVISGIFIKVHQLLKKK